MDWRLRMFLWLLHRKPERLPEGDLSEYRRQAARTWKANRIWIDGPLVRVGKIREFHIENRAGFPIRVRSYKASTPNKHVLFYLHGGGWVGRDIDTYDNFCRRVCRNTGYTVYSIEYRKSPETKFPGAIEDGVDVIRHLAQQHLSDGTTLSLCGDSAGGNMAIGITYLLHQEIRFQKLLVFFPPFSTDLTHPSFETYGRGFILEKGTISWMRDQYLPLADQYDDPLISPVLFIDFEFLPDTMITVGGKDPLYDQVMEFTQKVRGSGSSVKLIEYPDLTHGFYLLGNLSGSVRQAYQDVYEFLT